jgi:dTDP-4-amino-4,6-dideoxygalactose transaminase
MTFSRLIENGEELLTVPFNRPDISSIARAHLLESVQSGFMAGDGPQNKQASESLSRYTGGGKHLLTPSCTHALELACRLIELKPGDEVILPSFNFPSAATAVCLTGATPVFIDVDRTSKNLTLQGVEEATTERTRAVIALHYAGVEAPTREIREHTDRIGAFLIEDAAHALGVTNANGPIGLNGQFSTYSFHETKNIQCGEGGSLQINDPQFIERAEVFREKGTNRRQYFEGLVDKYSWVDHGSSWLLADPLAAILRGHLETYLEIQHRREFVFETYSQELSDWASTSEFEVIRIPAEQSNPAHLFYMVAPSNVARTTFISELRQVGISAAFHYQPLDSSPAGRRLGVSSGCPVSRELGDRLVRLPLFSSMTNLEIEYVVEKVNGLEL